MPLTTIVAFPVYSGLSEETTNVTEDDDVVVAPSAGMKFATARQRGDETSTMLMTALAS